MKKFSKNDFTDSAICNYCGKWKPTDLTPQELEEMDWKCAECKAKETKPQEAVPTEQDRGSKEVSRYDPEYEFLVKLIQLVTKEGVPPQEVKALAEAHPFVTIDDVGDLAAQIWTLATEKYHIPREWLIKKLPKNASLKKADLWPSQEEAEDMLSHGHNSLSYNNDQEPDTSVSGPRPNEVDKTANGEFKGSEFSGTDDAPNPLTDIGPWSSPEDHGAKPQKSPFPNTNWLPADDQNLDQQAPSNVAASLNKKATDEGYWIDPNGNAFQVRDESTGFITHDQWIFDHRDMLLNDYGIEIKEDALDNLSARDMNNILISKGWTRIGDSPKGDVGIRVTDLRKIPAKVEDVLYSFYTGGKVYIEDLMGKYVAIQGLDTNLQKAVNQSLSRKGSLNKKALQQQDVVDFYLLSLLPPEYLNKEVSPDHYDALTIFKGIIESLRNEYIERGMHELKDEAKTTAWTKAIPESDMPEQIKKYYTFHDGPFPGRNYHSDPDDDSDYDSEPNYDYSCDNCGVGLNEDDLFNFDDSYYCESCESEAIQKAIREDVAFCETHKVFVTDDRDLIEYLGGKKVDDWDKHHDNGVCEVVRYNEGQKIWKEVEENAKKQLHLQFEERKKRREEKQPKQLKLRPEEDNEYPFPGPSPTASLKQAGEGRYDSGEGWWEAPTDFSDYTAQDFYTIFEYAPWKHMYGGPLWAEIAKTIYQMQQTMDWQKLVVLIDHYHDLGHNSGKLLDKFPEWHKWFKNLLDQKAKKNSLRYLLPRASKPVQSLVTDFLRVHGRDWRADEEKEEAKPKSKSGWQVGDDVLVEYGAGSKEKYIPAKIVNMVDEDLYSKPFEVKFNGIVEWVSAESIKSPQFNASSLNRPFSKKALLKQSGKITRFFTKKGQEVRIYENPSFDQASELLKNSKEPSLRYIVSPDGNLYLWDGWYLDHYTAADILGLEIGSWNYDGEIFSDQQLREQLGKELKVVGFNKKANPNSRYWIAPDGKEFEVFSAGHGKWIDQNKQILKQYGINTSGDLNKIGRDMYAQGWSRISNEPAGSGFQIQVNDPKHIPSYLDNFVVKNFSEGDKIVISNMAEMAEITDPFPSLQKSINKNLQHIATSASLKQAAISGEITNKILQSIHNNGGTTYNLSQGEVKEGFVVSTHLDREQIVDGVDFDVLEGYIENNQDLLNDANNSFGAWTNNGKVFLDVVTVVPDKEKALELGREHGQLAIWDLAGNQELYTGVQRNIAFSKKELLKRADKSLLSEEDQNQIAAKWTPIMNIALNNYSRAVKNGHDPKRALKFAEESVINIGGVKESDLQEAIGIYLKGLI